MVSKKKKKKKKKKKVFTKVESDFSAENVQNQVVSEKKKKKKKKVSPKLRVIFRPKSELQTFFRPKSGGLQKKKKKKKVFTRVETDFAAGFVTFRSVGGMEPNYSK